MQARMRRPGLPPNLYALGAKAIIRIGTGPTIFIRSVVGEALKTEGTNWRGGSNKRWSLAVPAADRCYASTRERRFCVHCCFVVELAPCRAS